MQLITKDKIMTWLDEDDSRVKDRESKFKDEEIVYYWFLDDGEKIKIGLKKSQSAAAYAKEQGMKYLYRA